MDITNTQWLLSCHIHHWRDWRVLTLDQEQYITCILSDFSMEHCNVVKTPCPSFHLTSDMCPTTDSKWCVAMTLPYHALVGKCMYLSNCTRPYISFAVQELAHFMSNYSLKHYKARKHLLRYLQGTHSCSLTYRTTPNPYPIFMSFAVSDLATSDNLKSVSRYIVKCGNGPLTWSSKQQVANVLFFCKAGYLMCFHCTWQVLWLRFLFHELGFPQQHPTLLYCNNQGTVACTHDPQSHSHMRYIDVHAHFICDTVNCRLIDVLHIPNIENPTDLFTKPLQCVIHFKWLMHLNLNKDLPSNHVTQSVTTGCRS